ncbi:hypothetical protein J4475_03905 [Candidatus Woesearchaeota archaeon]|nr:hypothetical protein [Candidatus Woesearchaeota archaeon]
MEESEIDSWYQEGQEKAKEKLDSELEKPGVDRQAAISQYIEALHNLRQEFGKRYNKTIAEETQLEKEEQKEKLKKWTEKFRKPEQKEDEG